ncbi:MAG: PQQ-dependent sugar dehydrogenase [Phototrophicaceae bacterium]
MLNKFLYFLMIILSLGVTVSQAQTLPTCSERDFLIEFPRINADLWCMEAPIRTDSEADIHYTSFVFDDEGILYATHPYAGQVVMLRDSDNDSLPDDETILAEGLAYPNGITRYEDMLYVMGDGVVYTIDDTGTVSTLIDDLPSGRGFIARAILIHEEKLYLGIPSPCDFCVGDNPLHGTIIRTNLDGSEREVIAQGLRYPTALAIYQDALWVTDIARDGLPVYSFYDEINRIDLTQDAIPHFGFPYCIGAENTPDLIGDFDCSTVTAPTFTLQTHSSPMDLSTYDYELFPRLQNSLIVVLMGSNNNQYIAGHAVLSIELREDDVLYEILAPVDAVGMGRWRWEQDNGYDILLSHAEFVNNQAGGIWGHYPYAVAPSPEGWLYFSVSGIGMLVFRPHTP